MKNTAYFSLFVLTILFSCSKDDSSTPLESTDNVLYFPPINSEVWETKSVTDLSWNAAALQPLLDYLEDKNTKSFMMLHDGKIIVEQYFNNHIAASPWYWASAGKTLTTAISGIAQEEGLINIDNKVSDYLGTGWRSASLEKENLITCKNLLSMNSGLDDGLGDNVSIANLKYMANAGSRWAYHNVYVKMQDVVSSSKQPNMV